MTDMEKIDATRSFEPPVKCADCGKFIAYAGIVAGLCKFTLEQDSHFGPEVAKVADWSCPKCSQKDRKRG